MKRHVLDEPYVYFYEKILYLIRGTNFICFLSHLAQEPLASLD